MLKSCKYCGRIHDMNYVCPYKPSRQYNKNQDTNINRFRSSIAWQKKRDDIKKRDLNLCQICIRNLYNTNLKFNYDKVEVHHITPLDEDFNQRLNDDNLISLCAYHHKMAEIGKISRKELYDIVKSKK